MAETTTRRPSPTAPPEPDLRNPALAGLLAWLFPGAGHLYQRRYFKGALFAICIWPIMLAGLFMGSYRAEPTAQTASGQIHFARTVYCSWRPGDKRLYFVPQACVGAMALPALWQARFPSDADGSFSSTAFAPPRIPSESQTRPNQPDANDIARSLHSWLDVSTIFTVVAGLLNLLVVFDAIGGPAPVEYEEETAKKEDGEEETKEEKK